MPGMVLRLAVIPGGVGYLELLLLFTLILVLFGPDKLPKIARKLGQLMECLRRAAQIFQQNLLAIDDAFIDDPSPHADMQTPSGADECGEKDDGSTR